MDSFDDINWDKVDEPQQFFNLSDGFDKKDLKRSYNSFIKKYKPEKYPEEFQKIRKAYEEALNFLKTGYFKEDEEDFSNHSALEELGEEFGYDELLESDGVAESKHLDQVARERVKLFKWLEEKPLSDFYQTLTENAEVPTSYYHLAVVADVVEGEEDFLFWILNGIKKNGLDHEALGDILNEYVKKYECLVGWKDRAISFSKQCPAGLFYLCLADMMSELGHILTHSEFEDLLETCESNLTYHDDYLSEKCYFYLKLVIEFALKGDVEWLDDKREYIDQNQELLSEPAYEFFEVTSGLFAYRELKSIFGDDFQKNAIMKAVTKCIESFCTRDGIEIDQSFLATVYEVESAENDLLNLVPFQLEDNFLSLLFNIFFFIASNQSVRLPFDDEPEISDTLDQEIEDVVFDVDKKTNASFLGSFWGIFNLGYMAILAIIALLPLLLFTVIEGVGVVLGVEVVWALLLWFVGKPKIADPLRDRINISIAIKCYKKIWRPIVLKYMLERQCPLELLLQGVDGIRNEEQNTPYLHMFMESDHLLSLVSIANRFK